MCTNCLPSNKYIFEAGVSILGFNTETTQEIVGFSSGDPWISWVFSAAVFGTEG